MRTLLLLLLAASVHAADQSPPNITIYNSDGTVTLGRTITNISHPAVPPEFELHWRREAVQILPPAQYHTMPDGNLRMLQPQFAAQTLPPGLPDFMPGASWPTNTIANTNEIYSGIATFIFKSACPKCRTTSPRCDSVEFIRGVRDNDAVVNVQKYEFKCGKCSNKWRKNNVVR